MHSMIIYVAVVVDYHFEIDFQYTIFTPVNESVTLLRRRCCKSII